MGQIEWFTISGVKFCREDFVILSSRPLSVVGSLPYWSHRIRPGMLLGFEGMEVKEPRYGLQFKPTTPQIHVDFAQPLSVLSACVLTLGEPIDLLIPAKHHKEVVRFLEMKDKQGLQNLIGDLGKKTLQGWVLFEQINQLVSILSSIGVSGSLVGAILSMYPVGEVLQDPWRLVLDQILPIEQVEKVAIHLGLQVTDRTRAEIFVIQALQNAETWGSTGCLVSDVVSSVLSITPQWGVPQAVNLLKDMDQRKLVRLERIGSLGAMIYLPATRDKEDMIAKLVLQRVESAKMGEDSTPALFLKSQTKTNTLDEACRQYVAQYTHLSPDQQSGVERAIRSGVFLLTGLPGTGKTTTLRTLISIFHSLGLRVRATAPTGIAARKIQEVSQGKIEASTIHSAFGYAPSVDLSTMGSYFGQDGAGKIRMDTDDSCWRHGPDNLLSVDVLIMDEGSMIDQTLFHRVLIGTPPTCRIILVGDPAQIPSIGPGQILTDLLQIPQIPQCSFTAIFRQNFKSPILEGAFGVHYGKVPPIRIASSVGDTISSQEDDFVLLEASSDMDAQQKTLDLISRIYEDPLTFGSSQLLTPRHGGEVGAKKLNEVIRERLNPSGPEMKFRNFSIREGDRVMITRNNAQDGYYNGDLGSIRGVDELVDVFDPVKKTTQATRGMVVSLTGPPQRDIFLSNLVAASTLRLAYAITFHKSQGQEYNTVVILLMPSFGNQVSKRLLYTAITRAKRRCILVGTRYAFESAIARNEQDVRRTSLSDRIRISVAQG